MACAPGEESRQAGVAARRSRRQPPFGQIRPSRGSYGRVQQGRGHGDSAALDHKRAGWRRVTDFVTLRTDTMETVMAAARRASELSSGKRSRRTPPTDPAAAVSAAGPAHASVLEEARRAGLLDGEKTEHVSFRAPPALVAAAKRDTGISSTSELGVMALAMLARPDPITAFFRRTEGRLGRDHDLEL